MHAATDIHTQARADYNYWKLPWYYVRTPPMLAGHDLTSSYIVPYKTITIKSLLLLCFAGQLYYVYIVTVSASLLVLHHNSWGTPTHLVVLPSDLSLAIA